MFKCSRLLLFVVFISLGCSQRIHFEGPLLDVEKLCGEDMPLVLKIMKFQQNDFRIQKPLDPRWEREQIWDMKNEKAPQYGLKWVQLRFYQDKLQAVWFGPRTNLESDLAIVGIETKDLRDKSGEKLEDFSGGTFYFRDLNNQSVRVDHEGGPEEGTSITCFPIKRR